MYYILIDEHRCLNDNNDSVSNLLIMFLMTVYTNCVQIVLVNYAKCSMVTTQTSGSPYVFPNLLYHNLRIILAHIFRHLALEVIISYLISY